MTKKSKSPVKETQATGGTMGRMLFYSIALVVACCAVAVVLFETDVGKDFLAKVQEKVTASTGHIKDGTKVNNHKSDERNEASEKSVISDDVKAREHEDGRLSSDTSASTTEEAMEDDMSSTNIQKRKDESERNQHNNINSESNMETEDSTLYTNENDEPATNVIGGGGSEEDKEEWEKIDDELDRNVPDEEQETLNGKHDGQQEIPDGKHEEQQETLHGEHEGQQEIPGGEHEEQQEKLVDDVQIPVVEMEKVDEEVKSEEERMEEQPIDSQDSFDEQAVSVEPDLELKEGKDVPEQLENGNEETMEDREEETLSVGDSLVDLEKRTSSDNEIKEERYEPISEPEGPPIDQSPVHIRRGLRGDYGGKDCKDSNKYCAGWAKVGECEKNPVWMQVNCKKSCDVCSCSDNNIKCGQWAATGECQKNPAWMKENCMKSCEQC